MPELWRADHGPAAREPDIQARGRELRGDWRMGVLRYLKVAEECATSRLMRLN
jgi:hypothetical protein